MVSVFTRCVGGGEILCFDLLPSSRGMAFTGNSQSGAERCNGSRNSERAATQDMDVDSVTDSEGVRMFLLWTCMHLSHKHTLFLPVPLPTFCGWLSKS